MRKLAVLFFSLLICVQTWADEIGTENKDTTSKIVVKQKEKKALKEFKESKSGLKYRILTAGKDPKPTAECKVKVHYRGWFPDKEDPTKGSEFDSSIKRGRSPIEFPLNGVIAGWTEGVQLIGKGGKLELEIPPNLAYGERGMPGAIPPNSTLRFEIELLDFEEPPKPGPVDADAPKEFSKTASGLQYRIRRKGKGKTPAATDTVTVHYKGWFPDKEDPSKGKGI